MHMLRTSPWLRWVVNTNPFYLLSVCLVMIGIQLSFSGTSDLPIDWVWRLLSLLCCYTLSLAAIAIVIVRLGRVWDDARTIILLSMLMLVAIASSFDRVCLDDWRRGARLMSWGLAFSLSVVELIVGALGLKVQRVYRVALYGQLALLFAAPVWLGFLSLTGQDARMSDWVVLFPTLAGLSLLILFPATIRGCDVASPGNWRWPIYPYSAFVIVGIGLGMRSWGLTISFDLTLGLESGFLPYFLVPFYAAAMLLFLELLRHQNRQSWVFASVCLPLVLLLLVFPGQPHDIAKQDALLRHQRLLGSPAQVAILWMLVSYVRSWLRGSRLAGWGAAFALAFVVVVDRHTISLETLAPAQQLPLWCLIVGLAFRATWTDRALPMVLACLLGILNLAYLDGTQRIHEYITLHLCLATILCVPRAFEDTLASWIRQQGAAVSAALAVSATSLHSLLFPEISGWCHLVVISVLFAMTTAFWVGDRQYVTLRRATLCLACLAVRGGTELLRFYFQSLDLNGRIWLGWGIALLILAAVLSLVKGGAKEQIAITLNRLNGKMQRI